MAASFRAQATDSNSGSASVLTLTIPSAAQVGDDALLSVVANDQVTLTTPSGWTLLSGPDIVTGYAASWLLRRTLIAGDPGSVVTLNFSASSVCLADMVIGTGTTTTGLQFAVVAESTATSSLRVPTLSNVPTGAWLVGFFNRQYPGSPMPSLGTPSGFTTGPYTRSTYGGPERGILGFYQATTSAGSFGGGTGSSSRSTRGINYLVAFRPSGTIPPVTVTAAVAATAAAVAPAASTVAMGLFAQAVPAVTPPAVAPAGASAVQVLPPVVSGAWPPDPYRGVIRSGGYKLWYSVDASYGGSPVAGATDLRPTGGSIVDTAKPGARRTLNLEVAPEPGLYDKLAPIGTLLTVTAHLRYPNGAVQDIPMGMFDIDQQSLEEGGGRLSLTAPDKWMRIQRANFLGPAASIPGQRVIDEISRLIRGALGAYEPIQVLSSSAVTVGALTWNDRAKAIQDMATDAALWVYFDRYGTATIADMPQATTSADWLIDASPSGVLVSLSRQKSRTSTYNVVVVESSTPNDPYFGTQIIFDSDPTSPTYAGPDPFNQPELAGPFGISVYRYPTPQPMTSAEARGTGAAILARTVGLASQVSLTQSHNPAIDALASIDVLGPQVRYDIPRTIERHLVDTVTHPLDVTQPQQIQGRSTRADAYT